MEDIKNVDITVTHPKKEKNVIKDILFYLINKENPPKDIAWRDLLCQITCEFLFGYTFQPLHHGKHYNHGSSSCTSKYQPASPDRYSSVKNTTDEEQ